MPNFEATIEIEDPEFFAALKNPSGFTPFLAKAMEGILSAYQQVAEVYAPESEANRPGRFDQQGKPMGYYERGRGWWHPVVTHNRSGLGKEIPTIRPHSKSPKTMGAMSLLARDLPGVAGYKLTPTSEQMHDRWSREVHSTVDGVVGNLRNTASYADLVQGMEQIPLHASRGWRTVMTSWEDSVVQAAIDDETTQAIADYYHLGA